MEKRVLLLIVVLAASLFNSCGDAETKSEKSDEKPKDFENREVVIYSPESDAVDLAEVICVIEKLHLEMTEANEQEKEKIMGRIIDLGKTADELNLLIEEKYADDEEALEIFREILINYEC